MGEVDLFARLCAHWPALAGDDAFAEIRAHDWLRTLRAAPQVAAEVVENLIAGWSGYGVPHVADFREAAQQALYHRSLEGPKAIEAAPIEAEKLDAIVLPLREKLAQRTLEPNVLPVMPKHHGREPLTAKIARANEYRAWESKHVASYDETYPQIPQDVPRDVSSTDG